MVCFTKKSGWYAMMSIIWSTVESIYSESAPSQYPKRRLFVRSRKVSKPRDLYLELPDRSEIWQALRQHCCRCACQISKRCDNLKYQSRGFETSRDLTKRRLFGYWDGALVPLKSVREKDISLQWMTYSINQLLLITRRWYRNPSTQRIRLEGSVWFA